MTDACPQEPALVTVGGATDLRSWQHVAYEESTPFVHRFRTRRHRYVYDVNTRQILRVSGVVWEVLGDHGRLEDEQIMARHAPSHGEAEVLAALEQISLARREKGVFLSVRPKEVRPPGMEKIAERLEGQREQLILNVTEDCNFRCAYCVFGGGYKGHRSHSSKAMSWDVARAAIDEFLAHSRCSEARAISLYGGEPLLNLPLIRLCVAHVRQAWSGLTVSFAVTTNGSLLSGPVAEFLAAEGFLIVVSLDGPQDVHDRHRRARDGTATWDRVVANVRGFLDAWPEYRTNRRIRFNAVATRTTDLGEVQRFFGTSDLFTDAMGLELAEQKWTGDRVRPDDVLAVSSGELYAQFLQALREGLLNEQHAQRSRWVQTSAFQRLFLAFHRRGYLSSHLPETVVLLNTCIPGARRTFVNADGDYFACERVVESEAGRIGNVRTGVDADRVLGLLERWSEASGPDCRYCWCLPTCAVGCFASLDGDGDVTEQSKRKACAVCRRRTDQMLAEYCEILEENPNAFDYASRIAFA